MTKQCKENRWFRFCLVFLNLLLHGTLQNISGTFVEPLWNACGTLRSPVKPQGRHPTALAEFCGTLKLNSCRGPIALSRPNQPQLRHRSPIRPQLSRALSTVPSLASPSFARHSCKAASNGKPALRGAGPRSDPDSTVGPQSGPDCTVGPRSGLDCPDQGPIALSLLALLFKVTRRLDSGRVWCCWGYRLSIFCGFRVPGSHA